MLLLAFGTTIITCDCHPGNELADTPYGKAMPELLMFTGQKNEEKKTCTLLNKFSQNVSLSPEKKDRFNIFPIILQYMDHLVVENF